MVGNMKKIWQRIKALGKLVCLKKSWFQMSDGICQEGKGHYWFWGQSVNIQYYLISKIDIIIGKLVSGW